MKLITVQADGIRISEEFLAAISGAAEALHTFAVQVEMAACRVFLPRTEIRRARPRHGFTPDFDLACTVCGNGPEGHDGREQFQLVVA